MTSVRPTSPSRRSVDLASQRMPRCCASHSDWNTLSVHLAAQFPAVQVVHVDDEIDRAREATVMFGLPSEEQIPTAEIVARHNLMLLTGQIVETSRLDPESHQRSQRDPNRIDLP